MKLQGMQQNVSNLFGHVNEFHNILKLFKTAIERNDLTHFLFCKGLPEDLSNYEGSDFCAFVSNILGMMEEFQTRFTDLEITKNDIALFHNTLIVLNEEQPADLQADPIFSTMKERELICSKSFVKKLIHN
jgi:hypothetical protein